MKPFCTWFPSQSYSWSILFVFIWFEAFNYIKWNIIGWEKPILVLNRVHWPWYFWYLVSSLDTWKFYWKLRKKCPFSPKIHKDLARERNKLNTRFHFEWEIASICFFFFFHSFDLMGIFQSFHLIDSNVFHWFFTKYKLIFELANRKALIFPMSFVCAFSIGCSVGQKRKRIKH